MNIERVVIVSGGSRGLGLALVKHLLHKGHTVVTFARKKTTEISDLILEYHEKLYFDEVDLQDAVALKQFLIAVNQKYGRIDALINNAAIGQDHLLVHTPEEAIHNIVNINLVAPIILTRLVLKYMLLANNGGRIVNISSICAERGYPGLSTYSATKGALNAFTRSLAREVGERKIYINSIAPGFFESEMSSVLRADQLNTIKRRTPTKELTQTSNILPIINMLLFEQTNITGQTIFIDGGISN
ncbi:3-oxoacyl-[acyl-carrier protein] reductase [Desulfocicer vacuolatum DSM 3385]|uniref:3-oxoacyl-[acyl-carrier protein] reductase n=2 Tax=Desulfocicer vacuolatum TaxID=2298 RepID=A0A1W1Z5S5_9BACT|nr:3-oxoacyl-[acyl-carrier protein] reductase [Desulfocicer vacuolatum DSM 3385]